MRPISKKKAGQYIGDRCEYIVYGGNQIEALKNMVILHDVDLSIPYITDSEPVKAKGLSKRVAELIDPDEPWTLTDEALPAPASCAAVGGTYVIRDNAIIFVKKENQTVVSDGWSDLTAVALSGAKETPVGVVCSCAGGILFLVLLAKRRRQA